MRNKCLQLQPVLPLSRKKSKKNFRLNVGLLIVSSEVNYDKKWDVENSDNTITH